MIAIKFNMQFKNDEQRKSAAKIFHDISKALFIAALIESIMKETFSVTIWKLLSLGVLCVAAGFTVEEHVGSKMGNNG